MMIVAALGTASPGELILVANYGDGGDAIILKVTEKIRTLQKRSGDQGTLGEEDPYQL